MPNLQHLVAHGVSGNLKSSIPTQSNTAWTTFMTGVNPGKHGVFSFQQRSPNDPALLVGVNSRSIRRETLFGVLSRQGRTVGAVNVPVTYPPFPVNGYLLSGMFVPTGADYTHPRELAAEIDAATGGFPLNRIRWRFMPGQFEQLLDEAIEVNLQRTRVLVYLMDNKAVDVFVQVFVSPDRIQHALMHLIDPAHPRYRAEDAERYRAKIHQFFGSLDEMLGQVIERVERDGATLLVMSDHGFRPCDRQLVISDALTQQGLLHRNQRQHMAKGARRFIRRLYKRKRSTSKKSGGRAIGSDVDWSRTRAYVATATDQGVVINLMGREPHGIVRNNGEYERTRDEVLHALEMIRDPSNGARLIDGTWRREELFTGPYLEQAPDVIYSVANGLSVGNERSQNLAPLKWRTGEHDLYGILIGYGPALRSSVALEDACLTDLAPTILYLAGAELPSDLDGRVLLEAIRPELIANRSIVYELTSNGYVPETHVYSEAEELEIAEQLRGLGYL